MKHLLVSSFPSPHSPLPIVAVAFFFFFLPRCIPTPSLVALFNTSAGVSDSCDVYNTFCGTPTGGEISDVASHHETGTTSHTHSHARREGNTL